MCFYFSACKNYSMGVSIPVAGQTSCIYCFCYSVCKNRKVGATIPATRLYIHVFTFPLVKIVTQGQLYQQLVR